VPLKIWHNYEKRDYIQKNVKKSNLQKDAKRDQLCCSLPPAQNKSMLSNPENPPKTLNQI